MPNSLYCGLWLLTVQDGHHAIAFDEYSESQLARNVRPVHPPVPKSRQVTSNYAPLAFHKYSEEMPGCARASSETFGVSGEQSDSTENEPLPFAGVFMGFGREWHPYSETAIMLRIIHLCLASSDEADPRQHAAFPENCDRNVKNESCSFYQLAV